MHKALIFAAGALVGALGGIFTTKALMVKKFNQDLEEVRKYYRSRNKLKIDIPEEEKEEEPKKNVFQTSSIDLERYKNHVQKYNKQTVDAFDEKPMSVDLGEPTKPDISEGPICIPPKDFLAGEESGEYESEELIFYEDDEVLADPNDEVVAIGPDIDDLVGVGNIDRIGEFEPDMVYIRKPKLPNESKGTQYSISVVHSSYEQTTGIPLHE